MKLSIVIPAFNERGKIADDVDAACLFLERNKLEGEVIVADDGSTDETSQEAKKAGQQHAGKVDAIVIRNELHRGKGHAVSNGIRHSTGDYVMFADSGNCVPYENALRGIELLTTGQCDLAHGSRNLAGADIKKDHGLYRHICSEFFHWFAVYMMHVPAEFTDTQCGFKIYRGDIARRLFAQCITDGFMFDIEIILRALKQGLRIKEFPIYWTCDTDSRLSPAKSFWRVFTELTQIKKQLKAGK
jgi:dolichyl-phosphate beta-glucosyltransferase